MTKYTKIETIYNRDTEGTKKLIEGSYRNEAVEFLKDNTWEFTEKIDGTNIGIVWDGHRVTYQGRTERAQIPAHLMNRLIEMFGGETSEELFEQKFRETPVILFGEGYGPKIQKGGGNYRSDVSFILFDVFFPNSGVWLKREGIEDVAHTFGIDAVPIVLTGTLKDAVDFVRSHPKSTIGTADMEGVVGKPKVDLLDRMGRRIIVKVKCRDFV